MESGTDPDALASVRDISAPPRRPESWIFTPLAPPSMVCSIARFIVRRKLERFWSCSAMSSLMSWASISGRLTSTILISIRRPVSFCSSSWSFSTSAPLRPMITPGRAVDSSTVTASRVRSISILGIPAKPYLFLMNLRISKSSTSRSLNSCWEAYQRLRQSSITPTRNPVGRTF